MKKYGFISVFVFLLGYFFYLVSEILSLPKGAGYFYPVDDVYIHLEVAKNIADTFLFSINSHSFDPASSSLLNSLLLSLLIKTFGDSSYYPLFINFTFGVLTSFYAAHFVFLQYGKKFALFFALLLQPLAMVYLSSILGMEHTLHIFLIVLFFIFYHRFASGNVKDFSNVLTVVFFLGAVRFESVFLVSAVAFVFILQKKFKQGLLMGIAGFSPIIIYGIYSLLMGGLFFPNSVLVKSNFHVSDVEGFITILKNRFLSMDYIKYLLPFSLFYGVYVFSRYRNLKFQNILEREALPIIILLTSYGQLIFGIMTFRYENYLMIAYLFILIKICDYYLKTSGSSVPKLSAALFTGYSVVFGLFKVYWYHPVLYTDSKNLYYNQYKLAQFLKKYYNSETVVANDIGAITYFTDIEVLDMYGLGSTEVAQYKYKNSGENDFSSFMGELSTRKNARIAAIYPEWFAGQIPKNWILVGKWKMSDFRNPNIRYVNFYAVTKNDIPYLRKSLKAFESNYFPR
ncbi:hypothetical protein [Chryseobacterium aureum]|uniref:hypothetical protein n=1 Tax=Chryseobacterium aureum TaxID=2497456 RepID=UPI000F861534|nr:hypothetical protein [Chryseobacterium aureum]